MRRGICLYATRLLCTKWARKRWSAAWHVRPYVHATHCDTLRVRGNESDGLCAMRHWQERGHIPVTGEGECFRSPSGMLCLSTEFPCPSCETWRPQGATPTATHEERS